MPAWSRVPLIRYLTAQPIKTYLCYGVPEPVTRLLRIVQQSLVSYGSTNH
jgi:hypothetical protein